MTSKPLLTVIVANYNSTPYIKECLDSIMNQTYKDLEIIVYDDCSTDNSPGIIKEYEKKHPGIVRTIKGTINRGVARSRHEAILQAESEYFTTLDSDDYYYHTQKLEKEMELVRHFKEKDGKDVLTFSNIVLVKEDKTLIGHMGNTKNIKEGRILAELISRTCMIPRDFIVKKEAYFAVGGYDFSLVTHEDWDLKIRLSRDYEYHYTGINGTAYRQHPAGLSSIPHYLRTNNLLKVFSKNRKLIPGNSRGKVKAGFQKFMAKRDKQFITNYKRNPAGARGLRILKRKLWFYYNLLLNLLIKAKWWIKR